MGNGIQETTGGARASGISRTLRLLALFCAAAAVLLLVSAAAGESAGTGVLTWEERMEQARAKYNEDTVNVYKQGSGKRINGKINVRFYTAKEKNKPVYTAIIIRESLKITDEAEIQAVLEVMARNENFLAADYGSIPVLKAQWIAHNLAYSMANSNEETKKLIREITGQRITDIVSRAKELDLIPWEYLTREQQMFYEMMVFFFGLDRG